MQFSNNSLLLYDKNTGIIILDFYNGFSGKNKVCTSEFKIDILTKKVYYVLYQNGHGKSLVLNVNKLTSTKKDDTINLFLWLLAILYKICFLTSRIEKITRRYLYE